MGILQKIKRMLGDTDEFYSIKSQQGRDIYNIVSKAPLSININNNSGTEEKNKINRIFKLPYERNKYFTGRANELSSMDEKLKTYSKVMLQGLSGMGKTQIAIEYVHTYLEQDTAIFWIDGTDVVTIEVSIERIMKRLGFSQEKISIENFLNFLGDNTKWVVVFDGINGFEIFDIINSYKLDGKFIFTTTTNIDEYSEFQVQVGDMSEEDAKKFIMMRIGCTDEEASHLLNELEGVPIALNLAVSYINSCKIDVKEYLKIYEKLSVEVFTETEKLQEIRKTILGTWKIILPKLKSGIEYIDVFIQVLAHLDGALVDRKLLLIILQYVVDEIYKDEFCEHQLNLCLMQCSKYNILTVYQNTIMIHKVVQDIIRYKMNDEEKNLILETLVKISNRCIVVHSNKDTDSTYIYDVSFGHLTKILDRAIMHEVFNIDLYMLICKVSNYLRTKMLYDNALQWLDRLESIEEIIGESGLIYKYDVMGGILTDKSEFKRAISIYDKALLLPNEMDGLKININIHRAVAYFKSDISESGSLAWKIICECKDAVEKLDSDKDYINELFCQIYSLSSLIQEKEGDSKSALSNSKKVLDICKERGENNTTIYSRELNNYAVLIGEDDPNEALEYYLESLKIEKELGNNQEILKRCTNIAALYINNNQYTEAKEYIEIGLKIYQENPILSFDRVYYELNLEYIIYNINTASKEVVRSSIIQEIDVMNNILSLGIIDEKLYLDVFVLIASNLKKKQYDEIGIELILPILEKVGYTSLESELKGIVLSIIRYYYACQGKMDEVFQYAIQLLEVLRECKDYNDLVIELLCVLCIKYDKGEDYSEYLNEINSIIKTQDISEDIQDLLKEYLIYDSTNKNYYVFSKEELKKIGQIHFEFVPVGDTLIIKATKKKK